jgi:hypothetical protein
MDALLSWRKIQPSDLPECLRLHPAKNGAEIVGHARAVTAWQQLFEMSHATRSALVEAHGKDRVEIVGFGFASFVKRSFAEDEVRNPRPGLNSRIIESIVNGNSVVATYEEVRDANTRGDLQQVILDTSWKNGPLTAAAVDEVRVLLGRGYQELFAGYRFSRILAEMVDEIDLWHVRGLRSFRVLDRFEDFRRANPKTEWNPERLLLEVTLDSMRADPHSVAAGLFQHHVPPQLAFTRGEQELLELALEGADDVSIAKASFVTLSAIKRRWSAIFERVGPIRPDLCPLDGEGTRGIQKRQRILTYVRSHPEELRPFDLRPQKTESRLPGFVQTRAKQPCVTVERGATMKTELLRFNGAVGRDPAIDAWMKEHSGELGAIARQWFEVLRKCGDEVRELLHDGCPVACLGDAPFGYVNVFTSHVNVGFFHGAALPDPAHLLQGTGKFMRHVKLRPETATNAAALSTLIDTAYSDIKARVENG